MPRRRGRGEGGEGRGGEREREGRGRGEGGERKGRGRGEGRGKRRGYKLGRLCSYVAGANHSQQVWNSSSLVKYQYSLFFLSFPLYVHEPLLYISLYFRSILYLFPPSMLILVSTSSPPRCKRFSGTRPPPVLFPVTSYHINYIPSPSSSPLLVSLFYPSLHLFASFSFSSLLFFFFVILFYLHQAS